MGSYRRHEGRGRGRGELSRVPVAQVVPALATFAVDDGFAYRIPNDLLDQLSVGSVVRVPLSGRRVRGYVVSIRSEDRQGLKEVVSVSGDVPVFHTKLLETLRWAAIHYVAPLSVLLAKPAPPNLPRLAPPGSLEPVPDELGPSPVPLLSRSAAAGRHARTVHLIGMSPADMISLIGPVLAAGRSALVVAPTVSEALRAHAALHDALGDRALLATNQGAAATTKAWTRAATTPGLVAVGNRETAFWPVDSLALAVVIGDGRRGLKDKQTPTTHVREVLRRRASIEKFALVLTGPVPTAEAMAAGVEVSRPSTRAWPLVEIVDRAEEAPGGGFITERCRAALHAVRRKSGTAFVFTHRRGYAPAFRCVKCRAVRKCSQCGARPDRAETCSRCGADLGPCTECGSRRFEPLGAGVGRIADELRRVFGSGVGDASSVAPVKVGTERDLVDLAPVDLAVVVDADALLLAPHYRAGEEALRVMARVAGSVGRGSGRRCMVQTGLPDDPVIASLRRAAPVELITDILERNVKDGFPPAGQLLVVELQNEPPDAGSRLQAGVGDKGSVFGPAEVRGRSRWLVQGRDLRSTRIALRRLVQDWRDGGTRVRVDADPEEL